MESIAYPPLMCPFPSAINPYATDAQQATIIWARRLRLLQRDTAYRRLDRRQYGMLMARAYPSAAPETLQIVTDWSTWLFLLDDQCDEAGMGHDPEQLARLHTQVSRCPARYTSGPKLQNRSFTACGISTPESWRTRQRAGKNAFGTVSGSILQQMSGKRRTVAVAKSPMRNPIARCVSSPAQCTRAFC